MVNKVVILAGGMGTRISEETHLKPKPMIPIGEKPILWHIMKFYSSFGLNEFIILLGYKGYVIKEYFANYAMHNSDITFNFKTRSTEIHSTETEPWRVTLIDTGEKTATGGRIKRAAPFIGREDFCMTYGDGLANVNIQKLIEFHQQQERLATITAVMPPARFGSTKIKNNRVVAFEEKPPQEGGYINGGFFVLSHKVFDYIQGDSTVWETEPLETLTKEGQLSAYIHNDFWQPMDTLRDKNKLESLWASGNAPWKNW